MKYSADLLNSVVTEITDKKKRRDAQYEAELHEAYSKVSELSEIDLKLARLGTSAAMLALSGDTEKINEMAKESGELQTRKNEILENLGIKKPLPDCEKCGDTAYCGGKLCECAKRLIAAKNIEKLNIKTDLSNYRFDNFELSFYSDKPDNNGRVPRKVMKKVLDMAKDYCQTFGADSKNIIFMGGVGLGKTHLSLAMVAEIAKTGANIIYASAQNLFGEIEKEHFSYSGETQKSDEVLNADLLVIDDLGTEFSTSFTQSVFYNIVNTRILSGLPTIINTNLSFGELEQRYTPRVSSRFIGNYEIIKFFGDDIRVQKAMKK
ncbi:MAG: ATP-binding protein [Clostridiales bacterium]|nr:ATP-binding protein [Candidatus Equinaster intestinalis]